MYKNFIKELNDISSIAFKDIFDKLTGHKVVGLKLLLDTDDIIIKYNLDNKIQFILDVHSDGEGKMKYCYDGYEIKPDGRYMGVERNVNILEILEECSIQKKYNPDIKHLQVKNLAKDRDNKLDTIL